MSTKVEAHGNETRSRLIAGRFEIRIVLRVNIRLRKVDQK